MAFFRNSLLFLLFVLARTASAGITIDNINQSDLKKFTGDWASVLSPSAVSGASSRGAIFGFELGLVGGMVQTPHINELAKEQDPNSNIAQVPSGGILLAFSVPLGISVEGVFLPDFKSNQSKFSDHNLGIKWTFTDLFRSFPLDMALKYSTTDSHMEFSESLAGPPPSSGFVKMDTSISTYLFYMGKKLVLLEPYVGVGLVQAKGNMTITDTLNFLYTGTQKASVTVNSVIYLGGLNLDLLLINLGVEYSKAFDVTRTLAKVSLGF